MNVLILAAGYGKRLGKLTIHKPKCLIEINKLTILDIWIKKIENIKIDKIYINTHYLHTQVEQHLKNYNYSNIFQLYEKNLLGTSGTIFKNKNFFKDDDLLVIHCDNYTNFDLNKLINAHKNRPDGCLITMLTFETNKPKESGIVQKNNKNILTNYFEKKNLNIGKEANAAIYVISKEIFNNFNNIEIYKSYNFAEEVIPKLIGKIYIYKTDEFFIDIGDEKSLNIARKWDLQKNA